MINFAVLFGSCVEIGRAETSCRTEWQIAACLQYNHNQSLMSSNCSVLTILVPFSRNTVLHRVGRGCPLWSDSSCLPFVILRLYLAASCCRLATAFAFGFTGLFSIFWFLGQLIGIQTSQKMRSWELPPKQHSLQVSCDLYIYKSTCQNVLLP